MNIVRFREEVIVNYYAAERRAGATPEQAYERLCSFTKRLDDAMFQVQRYLRLYGEYPMTATTARPYTLEEMRDGVVATGMEK